jgi:hypothetical protein
VSEILARIEAWSRRESSLERFHVFEERIARKG